MNPTQDLLAEHEGVLRVLDILEKLSAQLADSSALSLTHMESILDFLQVFVDKCHHGKEEDFLFPALSAVGTPEQRHLLEHLLEEHGKGRALVRAMAEAKERLASGSEDAAGELAASARAYIELMRHHIASENTKLFPLVDELLNQEKQAHLVQQFDHLELDRIGLGRHEVFHEMIHELSQLYLR